MRLKQSAFLFLAVAAAGGPGHPASAALAPEYDRLRQLTAVASSADVARELAEHGLIDRIEWMENLTFKVWAQDCFVVVTLTAIPPQQGMVGATDYQADPGAVECE